MARYRAKSAARGTRKSSGYSRSRSTGRSAGRSRSTGSRSRSVSGRRVSSTSRIRIEVVGVPSQAQGAARPAIEGLSQQARPQKARKF